MSIFKIDDVSFDVGVIEIIRKPRYDRINLGTTLDGTVHYLTKGVYFDYDIIISTRNMNVAQYDALYEVLTSPTSEHTVTVPYAQTTHTFNAILKVNNDKLLQNYTELKRWGTLTISAEALSYAKEATT